MYEYDVHCSDDLDNLIKQVDKALRLNWECQGGISTNVDTDKTEWFYQAMIRKVKEKEASK